MEYLDVFQLKEELKNNRLKNYLKDNKNIASTITITIQSLLAFEFPSPLIKFICFFTIGSEVNRLRRRWESSGIYETEIIKYLKETSTYKECLMEYQSFIKELAELIKNFNFTSVKEIVIYLQFLIENGFLSQDFFHQYYRYKYEQEYLIELCGAQVLSGKSVCRHMSSLFVDTLNELDKTACNILTTVQNNPPTKNIKLKDISWNHSIVGVKEDNNLILFDPVSKHFVNPYNIEETKIIEKYRAGLIDDGNLKKYYLISNDHEFFNTSQTKKKLKITYNPIKTINYNEYLYLVEYIKNIYSTNISLALEFYKSQNSKMRKITELKKELSPYSDQKITSWLVKK